jgi:hypothetical protein
MYRVSFPPYSTIQKKASPSSYTTHLTLKKNENKTNSRKTSDLPLQEIELKKERSRLPRQPPRPLYHLRMVYSMEYADVPVASSAGHMRVLLV